MSSKIYSNLLKNRNFIVVFLITLSIFAGLIVAITAIDKPCYVYLGNDEEQDYLGQAIRMHEVSKPSNYRHPGLMPKTILYWFLEKDNYTVEAITKAFDNAKIVGYFWIFSCLVIFLFCIKPYIRDLSPSFFLPILFINPAFFYWFVKYGCNFFLIGEYILIIGLVFRALILNEKRELDLHWILACFFGLGFGVAIRVNFLTFFMFFIFTVGVFVFFGNVKLNTKYLQRIRVIPIALLTLYLPVNIIRKLIRFRETGVILGVIALFVLFLIVIKKNKIKEKWSLVFYSFMYYVCGLIFGMFGYFSSMRKPIFSELNLTSLEHYRDALKTVYHFAPILMVALMLGLVILTTMIVVAFLKRKQQMTRSIVLLVFLWIVLSAGTLINLSHYSGVGSVNPYPGVPMRLLLHVQFFIAGLFAILVPLCIPKFRKLYMLALLLFSAFSFVNLKVQYKRLFLGVQKETQRISEIDNFLATKNDPVLFIEVVNASANIHYSMRNWGRKAGVDDFRRLYPNVFELNPEIKDIKVVENIITENKIKYVVTDMDTLSVQRWAYLKEALKGFSKKHYFSDGVIILEANNDN